MAGLSKWSVSATLEGEQLSITTRSTLLPEILRHLVESGAEVYSFTPQPASVSIPSATMIGYAGFYLLLALLIAVYHFDARDL